MKRCVWLFISSLVIAAAPMALAQNSDHAEVGAFVDYFRFGDASPERNFVGLGGRAAFNVHRDVQLEAEMAYDFKRNFTTTFTNGVTTELVTTHFRTLHGFFGPKFQTGSGPFRVFLTGKVGFENFSITNDNATAGFTNTVGLTNGTTDLAVYPGGGFEAFAGPIGIRAEVGDDIFFDRGAHNNLRVTRRRANHDGATRSFRSPVLLLPHGRSGSCLGFCASLQRKPSLEAELRSEGEW